MNVQEGLGETCSEIQLAEPNQTSNEIQVSTQILERMSNDIITKMREEMDNRLETILREIMTNKILSATKNPRSETIETQNPQPSEARSIGVHATKFENSDSQNGDHPLRASGLKNLRHPAKLLYRNEIDLNAAMISNEGSEEEDYHSNEVKYFQI